MPCALALSWLQAHHKFGFFFIRRPRAKGMAPLARLAVVVLYMHFVLIAAGTLLHAPVRDVCVLLRIHSRRLPVHDEQLQVDNSCTAAVCRTDGRQHATGNQEGARRWNAAFVHATAGSFHPCSSRRGHPRRAVTFDMALRLPRNFVSCMPCQRLANVYMFVHALDVQ